MTKRAYLNLRGNVPERRAAFHAGLKRLGYEVLTGGPCDLYVTWNRIGWADRVARECEAVGVPVLVAENAAWGNDFQGGRWLSLARGMHNTSNRSPYGGPERWDALDVELGPIRKRQGMMILPSRGIGPVGVAMPRDWADKARAKFPRAGFRPHPGRNTPALSLRAALAGVDAVYTWGSGAAVLAGMWGCDVFADMPDWIGAGIGSASREMVLRRMAWHQWQLSEIANGEAFEWLLQS